jgi:sucrose synthase
MICIRFQELGLEKGWGDTAKRVLDILHLLLDLLEAPDPANLEKFLGSIPMMFNVVILSPHGYFAQSNVLGYPDTGGQVQNLDDFSLLAGMCSVFVFPIYNAFIAQVVYILDQVRALENEMLLRIKQQGLCIKPRILIVCLRSYYSPSHFCSEIYYLKMPTWLYLNAGYEAVT